MTAPVLERPDLDSGDGPGCQIVVGDDDQLCGASAVVSTIMSCPGGHPESARLCAEHHAKARRGDIWCHDCDPHAPAVLVAEFPL